MVNNDTLSKLVIASNNALLPWGQQQKMVNLFVKLIEKINNENKLRVERLEAIIREHRRDHKGITC